MSKTNRIVLTEEQKDRVEEWLGVRPAVIVVDDDMPANTVYLLNGEE